MKCGDPPEVLNGEWSPVQSEYLYENVITYTCDTGWYVEVSNEATLVCGAGTTGASPIWTNTLPVCSSKPHDNIPPYHTFNCM